jgi:hypothetical protein
MSRVVLCKESEARRAARSSDYGRQRHRQLLEGYATPLSAASVDARIFFKAAFKNEKVTYRESHENITDRTASFKVFKASEGNVIEFTGAFAQWIRDNYSDHFRLLPGSTDQPKVDDTPGCTASLDETAMQHNSNLFYSQIHRPNDTTSELVDWRPGQAGLQ